MEDAQGILKAISQSNELKRERNSKQRTENVIKITSGGKCKPLYLIQINY